MITIYDINGIPKLVTEIGEGSIRRYELMKDDYVQLRFSTQEPITFEIGCYVDFFNEDYVHLSHLGRFIVTEEYRPDYSSNTLSYNYTLTLEAEYRLWKNKIFKYLPEYGGQECSWTLTERPYKFLDVILANLRYYHNLDDGDDDAFVCHTSDGVVEYRYAFKEQTLGDGTTMDFNKKAVTVTFSNTSILDALNAIAQAVGCEWWIDKNVIWLGRCENFKGEYVEGEYIKDKDGNYVIRKDEDGDPILIDGQEQKIPVPITKDISLEYEGGRIPNAEGFSVSRGSSSLANRIYMFGSERNIPHYYRKKLLFTKTTVEDIHTEETNPSKGFLDSYRILNPFDFNSSTYTYASPYYRNIWTKSESGDRPLAKLSYKTGGTKELEFFQTGLTNGVTEFDIPCGLASVRSDNFTATLSGYGILNADLVISLVSSDNVTRQKITMDMNKVGDRFVVNGFPETEVRSRMSIDLFSICYIRLKYTFRFTVDPELDTESVAAAFTSGSNFDDRFRIDIKNLNPCVTTTGKIIRNGVKTETTFYLNRRFDTYYTRNAQLFTCDALSDSELDASFDFELDNIIKGRLKGSYFTNDAKNEVAVNGIVQKRLMLPIDTTNPAFNVATGKNKGVKQFEKYDDYFTDATKTEGKARIDYGENAVNQIVEQVVIDESIYPNIEDTISEEVVLETSTETDDDGNETTTYYYKLTGTIFGNFTKVFILAGTTLQITFGAGEEGGGKLNGMTFDAELRRENGKSYFRVVPNDSYAITLPNDVLYPVIGDKFALVNYDPAFVGEYTIYEAENRLVKAGYAYIEDMMKDKSSYSFRMMSDSSRDMMGETEGHWNFFDVGDVTRLYGDALFGADGRESRVMGIEFKLDIPYDTPTVICGESSAYSRLSALEGKTDDLIYKGTEYSTVGGGGEGTSVEIIKTDETTLPSNYNVFSSRRTIQEITKNVNGLDDNIRDKLSRVDDDTAEGKITFQDETFHNAQSTHNALARFNQDAEIHADSTERVMGTIKFMAPLSDGAETTPQERGYINGNGNAQLQTLDVKGRADLEGVAHIHELISEAVTGQAEDFIDGYDGHGLRIWKEDDSVTGAWMWHITADYLTIRQQMKVFELLIQKIRSTGGTIVVSNANGKVKSVSKSVDNTWRITFETGCDFAVGDIIRCQSWKNMREQGSHVETSAWTGKVYAVLGTGEDAVVIIPDTAEWFSGSTPKEGDECVQWGSTDEARQNIIYITAAEGDNPAVDMLGEVTGPGTGNLHVRIGKLDGIVTGSNVLVPQGWGLYADNAFLKGKFVLENGDDVYQRFVLQNGRLESTISETRALTTGDSIIANPAFLDGFQPWNYYHVTSQLLSDGELILSDGEKLLIGVGDATKYVGLVTEGMRTFVRIVDNESTDPDIGIEQDVAFMRQVDGEKTVELSFEYRIHESGDVLITLDSYKDGLVGSLSTEKTSDLYGLQSALVKDGEWHTARVYGTYVSGNGSIQVCAKGNVDLSTFQLYEAVGVQSLSTSITQTSEQIRLQADRITQQGNQIVSMNSSINVQAMQITALNQKVVTDEDGKITNISTAGLVTTDNMAGQMATNVSDPEVAGALQATYPTKEELSLYVLESAYNQSLETIARALDKRPTDSEVVTLVGSSGFVNKDSLASMFSGYWTYWKYTDEGASTYFPGYAHDSEGFIIDGEGNRQLKYNVSASISTFNFVEYANEGETWEDEQGVTHTYREGEIKGGIQLRADMIQQLAETIEIKANQILIESGEVIFHNENGSSSMSLNTRGDIVFSGVTHNQEQIINTSTGVNADLILNSSDSDTLPYYCGLYVGNLPSSGLLDTFDLLMCGDIIRVKQGRVGHSYIMPFYFPEYNTARVEGGVRYDRNGDLLNSNDWHIACRTKTRSGGALHYMTLDEMLKMVGRRITILFEYDDAGSAIYNLEMFRIDGEYFQDNEYHDGQISVRGALVGDRITSTLAVHYELCMGTYKNHSGNFGTCLYWHRLGGTSGDLTDWNDLP